MIFVAMIVEGDILIFASFFLVRAEVLNFWQTIIALFGGAIIGDVLWYFVGQTFKPRNRFLNWIFENSKKVTSKLEESIEEKTFRNILFSKFMYGMHHIFLLRCGIIGIDFKKIIRANIFATTIWIAIIGFLGYISQISFYLIKHRLKYIEIGLLLAFIIFVIGEKILSKIIAKRL
jgi:membrane protein DedA with SNARE-associated domain